MRIYAERTSFQMKVGIYKSKGFYSADVKRGYHIVMPLKIHIYIGLTF